ncbi:MAG: class II aldolase/adducin family protein [Candidatus Lokiarchaeota archaeon]|nr:class II aldolase/adducin family protein [Candidatus Lokiarchaeota archaeon]MBD3342389.1 class II aldolase/adducin family protein [Candidatus Lokiarchaeota archaeon]
MKVQIEDQLRSALHKCAKRIYEKGLVQAGEGNMSVRIPNKKELIVTPTYNKYYNLKTEDLSHITFDGLIIKGKKPSSEFKLHVEVYKSRPRAKCVIHTHSSYATMMSVARIPIPILLEEQVIFLGGSVNVSDFAVAHSDEFSKNAIKALFTKNGTLMANHGVLVCGRNTEDAIKMAELVEKLAFIYTGAKNYDNIYDVAPTSCSRFYEDFEKTFATHSEEKGICE